MGRAAAAKSLDIKRPLKNLYLIGLVGVVLAIGNFFFQGKESFIQVLLIQVFTTFNIGFPLMIIIFNKHIIYGSRSRIVEIFLLLMSFVVLAVLASELENIFRSVISNRISYSPFSSLELHLANSVITSVLGFAFRYLPMGSMKHETDSAPPIASQEKPARLDRIPVRHKRETLLVELDSVLYIEAYDNYSFVFRTNGEKWLCNYSLGYLETLLDHTFIRIHRKHMVNKQKIRSLAKHTHNRYKVRLNDEQTELVSSTGYAEKIRELVEI
jgi:DNA-binding LytR/AlgR family response regulator